MADSYSFGLVAWSTFFGSGERPPGSNAEERRDHIISELKETSSRKKAGLHLAGIFENALTLLLQEDPSQRPNKLEGLFGINKKSKYVESRHRSTNTTALGSRSNGLNGVQESLQVNFREGQFEPNRLPWELHPSHAFKKDLLFRYMDDPDSVPGDFLFTYFLELTMLEESSGFRIQPKHYSLLDVFETAAKKGFPPAQAIVPDVFAFYGKPIPSVTDKQLTSCLENAVRTGSTFARRHLQSRDPVALSTSMKFFEAKGGYGMFYATGGSNYQIHSIVASGHVDDLKDYLCQGGEVDINSTTIHGEPPLYLVCLRGSWDMAIELLNRGATAPGNYSQYGTTCLHWIFAFDPSIQSLAVTKLVESGIDIDSKASRSPPFFHYPFGLPAGTPLHWAVATGSHTAIQALVGHGASLNIRDGCDPYRYDHRIRILGSFGPRIEDVYSYSETGTQGLSPLDYAAIHHDPFIFELLLSLRKSVPINDVDEEGFTVMHRLSTLAERRTRSGVRFSFLPFQGDPVESAGRLARTIAAIKSLGGDLEKLTTPNVNKAQAEQNGGQLMDWEGDTPLMLAARGGRPAVVRALLEAGADVNHENKAGIMALHCISENRHVVTKIASLLVSAGAAVSHKARDGATPLQRAASMRAVEMMDLLLSHGADVDEVDMYKRSPFQGSSVFAHLARPAYNTADASDETYDEAVARLVEKHLLLAHVNVDERLRVVTRGAPGSTTLLGLFSQLLMRHTVSVLIRCGADVNVISRIRKTPLDTAIEAKESEELTMRRRRHRTLSQYEKICMRREAVIKIVRDAGGRRSTD
ncbi:ankyrin repeat-containing domain protein [Hypoxylon sp. FL1857]|nr:ankyrin repeat-containing domain protein [Hypoxylon sp. FL1857]